MTDRALPGTSPSRIGLPRSWPCAAADTDVRDLVERLAPWLLGAVMVDLVVTRIIVRLAIFVPKGEPWATVSTWLGHVGAVTDTLVPIVAFMLLGALALDAGRGSRTDRLLVVGTAVVAAMGVALVVLAPPPLIALTTDATIALVAIGSVVPWRPTSAVPSLAQLGLMSLGFAIAAAALGRSGEAGPLPTSAGQVLFVGGAVLLGVAGLRAGIVRMPPRRTWVSLGIGSMVTLLILGSVVRAPEHTGQLLIWSIGLTGTVPVLVVALAAGLAVAGMPALLARAPLVAIGGSTILLAGYDLVASGLVLAGLVALLVARHTPAPGSARRPS